MADSGLTSSRGPLARDWLGATPDGLDPVSCSGRAPASPLGDELYTYVPLFGVAAVDSVLHLMAFHSHTCQCHSFVFHLAATRTTPSRLITTVSLIRHCNALTRRLAFVIQRDGVPTALMLTLCALLLLLEKAKTKGLQRRVR